MENADIRIIICADTDRCGGRKETDEKMDKAVLISIQPKFCEKIVSGKKTVEVRKTKPKLSLPFTCYIYKTRDSNDSSGKVIGEFTCTGYDEFIPTDGGVKFRRFLALHDSRLSVKELKEYLRGKIGYGWRISELTIYDAPKDLIEFRLIRAPQSWCYVELIGWEWVEVNG